MTSQQFVCQAHDIYTEQKQNFLPHFTSWNVKGIREGCGISK